MPLTDTAIKAAKPAEKPRKLYDADGLYLEVAPSGGKWWRFKYRIDGKEKRLSLGVYPDVSLLQARKARDDARRQVLEGSDPSAKRQAQKRASAVAADNSFETVARAWHASWARTRSKKHADQVLRRMELDAFPQIGALPISNIRAPQIVAMAKKVEQRGAHDLARRAIQMSGQVFRYAIGHGLAEHNPCGDVQPADVLAPVREQNYARVDVAKLPQLLRDVDDYRGHVRTRLAIHLMALTFVRTSELIKAEWSEFNLAAAQWRIPAGRMKMKTEHIVPLSTQAVAVLQALQRVGTGNDLLFPGGHDHEKPMSNNAILFALYRMGYKGEMTGHGFRGIASTVLHELGQDHAVIELQLAHQERDRVSAAYNHATYLPQRTALMQLWADHLDALRGRPITLPAGGFEPGGTPAP